MAMEKKKLEALKERRKAEGGVPNLREQIGKAVIGGSEFAIFRGLTYTLNEVKARTTDVLLACYQKMTGDKRAYVDRRRLEEIVGGEVQIKWYELSPDRDGPSRRVLDNHERRKAEALETDTTKVVERGKSSGTVASVIREGLRRGFDTEQILKEVRTRFPDSRAGSRDVAYYRHQLKKRAAEKDDLARRGKAYTKKGYKKRKGTPSA